MKLIFEVPYTSYEVLVITDEWGIVGVAYDPLSTSPPTTWLSGCELCLVGNRHVPLKVRRVIRCLASLRPTLAYGYTVNLFTGKKPTHSIKAKKHSLNNEYGANRDEWVLTVQNKKNKSIPSLVVAGQSRAFTVDKGKPRDYRAPVLLRSLRLLLSAREASEQKVQAILRGLTSLDSPPKRHSHDAELVHRSGCS
jgi:hypothetical protein